MTVFRYDKSAVAGIDIDFQLNSFTVCLLPEILLLSVYYLVKTESG